MAEPMALEDCSCRRFGCAQALCDFVVHFNLILHLHPNNNPPGSSTSLRHSTRRTAVNNCFTRTDEAYCVEARRSLSELIRSCWPLFAGSVNTICVKASWPVHGLVVAIALATISAPFISAREPLSVIEVQKVLSGKRFVTSKEDYSLELYPGQQSLPNRAASRPRPRSRSGVPSWR